MSIIGKSKNPRCFGVTPSLIKYFAQANVWSDGATFKKWWLQVPIPFIRKWTHLPVLCLMDGCASHVILVDPTGQITTMVYPAHLHKQKPAYGHKHHRSYQVPLQEGSELVFGKEIFLSKKKKRKNVFCFFSSSFRYSQPQKMTSVRPTILPQVGHRKGQRLGLQRAFLHHPFTVHSM